ncbi:MAG TPA: tetratricopeptide repeat protein [Xanthobacteraceae bacterium]|nr:tetratricopeptide repeat protein [Xanthobacteraceae bacterium]
MATIACQRGRFDEGTELARKALAADPRHARAHVLLGRSWHALGQRDAALASFESAIAIAPGLAQAHGNRGDVLSELGRNAEAVESYDRAVALAPDSVEDWFNRGVALAAMERRDDALASFDRAVAARPGYAEAQLWRAKLLTELRRADEALEVLDKILASAPNRAEAWLGRGNTLIALRRYDEALAAFDRAWALNLDLAEAWLGRGNVFTARARYDEAFAAYDKALALNPNLVEAWLGRGNAALAAGKRELAVDAASRALALKDIAATRGFFVQSVRLTTFTADEDGRFRRLTLRALTEAWALPRQFAYGCISLIKLDDVVRRCIARVKASWPSRLDAAALFGASELAALARDDLLRGLLECQPLVDIDLERFFTNIRCVMLTAADGALDDSVLAFYCAVARQCFVNEYVFSVTDAEAEEAQRLRASLDNALAAGGSFPLHWPIVVAAYFPLHGLAHVDALLDRTWPQPIAALIVQQVKEPAQERAISKTIPALTKIADSVSRMVRQHYEDKPYPRWIKAGPPAWPPALRDRRPDAPLDVLIAGCGTGLFTIEFARQAPRARILAVDLSLASLSYAKRMAENFGLTNVEFGQADVMELGSIGRDFDFIAASGLLHHLGDPWKGWRVLLGLLRSDGIMQVGLYSDLARRNVVAAHELIAHRGYRPTPEDIRRCRDEIMALEDGSLLKSVTMWADFFTTNECGTLLFRLNEHRLTLPQIKSFLEATDLEFRGFILDAMTLHWFSTQFPQPGALTDLELWRAFESQAPQVFAGLYEFSVCKAALSDRRTAGLLH